MRHVFDLIGIIASVIGQLVGVACEAIGRNGLWKIVPHLTNTEARAARIRLGLIEAKRTQFSDAEREEEYEQQASLLNYFSKRNWASAIADDQFKGIDGIVTTGKFDRTKLIAQLIFAGKQRIYDEYTHYQDALVQASAAPYASHVSIKQVIPDPISDFSDRVMWINPDHFRDALEVHTISFMSLRIPLRCPARCNIDRRGLPISFTAWGLMEWTMAERRSLRSMGMCGLLMKAARAMLLRGLIRERDLQDTPVHGHERGTGR